MNLTSFLLGSLVTVALGIIANLLTPGMKPLWATIHSLQRRGAQSQIRQKIKQLQAELDRFNRFKASERAIYVYLFQWLFGIIGISVAAAACALVATVLVSAEARRLAVNASLILSLAAVTSCFVMVASCTEVTAAGIQKKIGKLERDIATLTAKLPESL
jgi:hypothetical protein